MCTETILENNQYLSSLIHLFQVGEHSDLTIKINNGLEFKVHKCILAARSPKLKAMLTCNMKESMKGVLNIENETEDFSELFSHMLAWIYTEK